MLKTRQHGFTVIEVLIVMAIAGLMLVIVFLAVPALQRNARNTRRKTDASFIASQRLAYDQDLPTTMSLPPGGFRCDSPLTGKIFCTYIANKLSFYAAENVVFHSNGRYTPTSVPTITDIDEILTDTYLKCNDTGTGAEVSVSAFSTVVLYAVETGGAPQTRCLQANVVQSAPN